MSSIKVMGKAYRVRTDADPEHLQRVESMVDKLLREIQRNTPDTQDAAVLAALNLASDLVQLRVHNVTSAGAADNPLDGVAKADRYFS